MRRERRRTTPARTALACRLVHTVLGYYVTARLAPYLPMRHMWILAGIAIAATALPCAWVAGAIYRARHATR